MTKSILILDDRKTFVERLTEVLRLTDPSLTIVECLDVDSAWRQFQTGGYWDVVVIDLMVPPGKLFENIDTGSGLNTGHIFAEKILDAGEQHIGVIFIHSSRNKGISPGLFAHPKVKELPKSEFSNVALADLIMGVESA